MPIAAARQRVRIVRALDDMGEMRRRGLRVVQEAQRDPAGGEMLVDAVIALRRRRRVAGDAIGGLRVVIVEQLADQDAPLEPPLIGVDAGVGRRAAR